MKKLLSIVLIVCSIFTFSGCAKKAEANSMTFIKPMSASNESKRAFNVFSLGNNYNFYNFRTNDNKKITLKLSKYNGENFETLSEKSFSLKDNKGEISLIKSGLSAGTSVRISSADEVYHFNLPEVKTDSKFNNYFELKDSVNIDGEIPLILNVFADEKLDTKDIFNVYNNPENLNPNDYKSILVLTASFN